MLAYPPRKSLHYISFQHHYCVRNFPFNPPQLLLGGKLGMYRQRNFFHLTLLTWNSRGTELGSGKGGEGQRSCVDWRHSSRLGRQTCPQEGRRDAFRVPGNQEAVQSCVLSSQQPLSPYVASTVNSLDSAWRVRKYNSKNLP